jgi:hypothetical protein
MRWFGPSQVLHYTDSSEGLSFTITTQRRRIDMVILITCAVGVVISCFGWHLFWMMGFFIVGSALFENIYLRPVTYFEVLEAGIWVSAQLWSWSTISGLEYQVGPEDGPSGLYARTGGRWNWSATCIVPNITRELTEQIIDLAYRRFPLVTMAEDKGPPTFFGDCSKLISLNLTNLE